MTTPVADRSALAGGVSRTDEGDCRIWFHTTTGVIDFARAPNSHTACIIADLIEAHVLETRLDGHVYRVRPEYFGQVGVHR